MPDDGHLKNPTCYQGHSLPRPYCIEILFPISDFFHLNFSFYLLNGLERRYLSFCSNNTEERLRTFMYNVDPKFKRMPGRKMVQHVPLKYIASYLGVAQATLSRLRAKIVRGDRRK